MEVHFRYAMELVDHTQPELDVSRSLDIYLRLHGLRGPDADGLAHRVLLALGRRATPAQFSGPESGEASRSKTPQSIVGQIRRRLRGRMNTDLREWVEYHTGRAETEVLGAHVDNALQFIKLLTPALAMAEAVALYAEELVVPSRMTETIYYLALARRSVNSASVSSRNPPVDEGSAWLFTESTQRSLRVVGPRRDPGGREVI
jgi:hypothetical protein